MDYPSFSIVMPTYQRRAVVCDAIAALGRLDYRGVVELIVVVDGSTDGTAEAVAAVDCPHQKRVITQPNGGAAQARNRGAASARHEIILFLDDDMFAEPDLLDRHAEMYREGADAVIGDTPIAPNSAPGFLAESTARWIEGERVGSPISVWDIFTGQLSVRAAVFRAIGGFDETLTSDGSFSNEDADFGVRLLARYTVRHNPKAITRQRYVVSPRDYMARAPLAVTGDLRFLRKHPQFSREVFDARGMGSLLGRSIYIPLSRIPFAAKVISATALWAAELAMRTPFRSNRLLARYFSGARSIAFWADMLGRRQLPGTERLLVLCYHAIRDQSDDPVLAPYGVAPDALAKQLDYLQSDGWTFVAPADLANFLRHGAPLPRRAVLLTFDDCYEDLLETARDVLLPRGIPALALAVTAITSGTNEWDQAAGAARLRLLNHQQLRDLATLGVEIGSHSQSHREMPVLDAAEQRTEAAASADDLVAIGLPRPDYFAYPFGSVDAGSKQAVKEAGYLAAFGCRSERARDRDRFDLPRVVIYAADHGWRFRMKVRAPRLFAGLERLSSAALHRLGMRAPHAAH